MALVLLEPDSLCRSLHELDGLVEQPLRAIVLILELNYILFPLVVGNLKQLNLNKNRLREIYRCLALLFFTFFLGFLFLYCSTAASVALDSLFLHLWLRPEGQLILLLRLLYHLWIDETSFFLRHSVHKFPELRRYDIFNGDSEA